MKLILEDWPTTPAGQVADGGTINRNNTRLEQILNGGITDENLALGVPVRINTTLAGLGTPVRNGDLGLLRLGSTPFTFLRVVHDATDGKWMSRPIPLLSQLEPLSVAPSGGAFSLAPAAQFPVMVLPNYKAAWDAGLRPQFLMAGKLAVAAGQVLVRVAVLEFSDGDTSLVEVATSSILQVSVPSGTEKYEFMAWGAAATSSAPTKDHAMVVAQVANTHSSALTVQQVVAKLRYRQS